MISCRQALDRAIAAADKAQDIADNASLRTDYVISYSALARAWSAIASELAILEQYEPADHEGNGHV